MKIYIPTYGRATRQTTFKNLPKRWQERTWFVIRKEEEHMFNFPRLLVCDTPGVPAARQAVIDKTDSQHVWMFDDDLVFSQRCKGWVHDRTAFLDAMSKDETGIALDELEHQLENNYAAVGMDARGGNNRRKERHGKEATRMMRAFGIDKNVLTNNNIRFDAFDFWEDFHVTLCLLKLGIPNWISMQYCNGGATNSKGGVSTYRTVERLSEVRADFVAEHSPFVVARDKKAKSWGGGFGNIVIPDVTVYWKKAYEFGSKK